MAAAERATSREVDTGIEAKAVAAARAASREPMDQATDLANRLNAHLADNIKNPLDKCAYLLLLHHLLTCKMTTGDEIDLLGGDSLAIANHLIIKNLLQKVEVPLIAAKKATTTLPAMVAATTPEDIVRLVFPELHSDQAASADPR